MIRGAPGPILAAVTGLPPSDARSDELDQGFDGASSDRGRDDDRDVGRDRERSAVRWR